MPFTNVVASSPTTGGGYPVPPGSRVPVAGTCGAGPFNANHSESWLAVKPGTEDLVGTSKFFFDKYSTFYMFYLGAYQIPGGTPSGNNQVQGYDCVSTGTQDMPPSWTDTTDPNVDFDTKGRVYQTMLPFNSFFDATKLHPDGEIDMSYSDDMGRHWVKGNGGVPLEPPNNASAQAGSGTSRTSSGSPSTTSSATGSRTTSTRPGRSSTATVAGSRCGWRSPATAARPSPRRSRSPRRPQVGAGRHLRLPGDRRGRQRLRLGRLVPAERAARNDLRRPLDRRRAARSARSCRSRPSTIPPGEVYPNTRFRSGIVESFAASPTYPGHLYLTYEDWDPVAGQADVKFTQSTDGGATWTTPVVVNDNVDAPGVPTDQFQPSVAAGPERRGRRRVLRPTPGLPERPERPACRRRPDELLHRHLAAGVQGQRQRGRAGRQRTCGSRSSPGIRSSRASTSAASRSTHAPEPRIPARRAAASSATTSGSRSPRSNIYALMVSTHYPSNVTADEGGPIYYQQQVLATVPRIGFGAGY